MTTISILTAINLLLTLLILIFAIGEVRAKNLGKVHPDYKILRPEQVLGDDLRWALNKTREALGTTRKGDAFPIKIELAVQIKTGFSSPCFTSYSWMESKDVIKVVGAILEQQGWVVYQDLKCGPYDIMIDIPRSKLRKPEKVIKI